MRDIAEMIAVSSSGKSFRALAAYLANGRSGEEQERVAWTASRNLPTEDPELAATFMRATAARSDRIEKPVYHVALSFDPNDPVDRATMERVADRVLDRLGLAEHQAIIVAHRDRAHAHLHLLVNRVHPETGKAWERWKDRPLIQEVLREEERTLGFREVSGTLAPRRVEEVQRSLFEETSPPPPNREPHSSNELGSGRDGSRNSVRSSRVAVTAPSNRGARSWLPLPSVLAGNALTPFSCMASMASALCRGDGGVAGIGGLVASGVAAVFDSPQAPSTESAVGSVMAAAVPLLRKARRELALPLWLSDVMDLSTKLVELCGLDEEFRTMRVKPRWKFREEAFTTNSRRLE